MPNPSAAADLDTSAGRLSDVIAHLRAARTDTARVEAKAALSSVPKSLWETVSAFANTSGGVIVLGLREDAGFRPADGFDASHIRDQFIVGMDDRANPKVAPAVPYSIDIGLIDETFPVVVIDIGPLPAGQRPCYVVAQGVVNGSYRRVGDGDRPHRPLSGLS